MGSQQGPLGALEGRKVDKSTNFYPDVVRAPAKVDQA